MANFLTILTTLGQAKIATAIANGSTVALSQIAVGDGGGSETTPDPTQTALVNEVFRAGLNSLARDPSNPNYVIAEVDIPASVGGWTVREVGLFDTSGALIAVGNFPDTYKPSLSDGSARDMVIKMIIEVVNTANVSLNIDPATVLASQAWVVAGFSLQFLIPGGTTGQLLAKHSNTSGDVYWIDPTSATNITVTTVEEDQTLTGGQTVVTLATVTTSNMAVYVNGIRKRATDYTVNSATQFTLGTAATNGDKLCCVQNEPAGNPLFLQTLNNLSDVPNKATARVNLGVDTPANIVTSVLQTLFPIGEIFATRRAGDPSTLLGFGTWQRYAVGKVLVGFDPSDASFNAIDGTGGEKAHVLTSSELAAHTHTTAQQTVTTSSNGDHYHSIQEGISSSGTGTTQVLANGGTGASPHTNTTGAHTHSVTIPSGTTGATGSNTAHNNLQPYQVINYWVRLT